MLYEIVVSLHILAASAWIGSMLFFSLAVVPVVRRKVTVESSQSLLSAIGARFRILGLVTLAVLVLTGVANLRFHGLSWGVLRQDAFWTMGFGRALAYKLSLVAMVLGAAVVHDALAKTRDVRRRVAAWSGRLILALSFAIVYFAVALVRGLP